MASLFKFSTVHPESVTSTPKIYPMRYCIRYPHNDIVNAVYDIFFEKYSEDNISSDIISWIFIKSLIRYKKYTKKDVKIIKGRVQRPSTLFKELEQDEVAEPNWDDHVWVYDVKEKFYIDIASQRFLPTYCLCSQNLAAFTNYKVYEVAEDIFDIFTEEYDDDYEIFEDDKSETIDDIVSMIGKKISRGGKRKSKRRLHNHRKTNRRFI